MNKLILPNYNIEQTLIGGQAFNWDKIDKTYYGFTQDKVIKVIEAKEEIYWQTYPVKDDFDFIKDYFQIDLDYSKVLLSINKDENILKAIKSLPSIRLLKQDFEQTLLSFILTSNKNIKAVRKCIRELSKKYAKEIKVDGKSFHFFPKSAELALLSDKQLRDCGVGFRSKYLKSAAEYLVKNKISFNDLNEQEAKDILLEFNGVGDKIADCVLIFSLGYYSVTPIDIWGKRVLTDLYKVNPKLKYSEMRRWYKNYFGEYTAWAGQILFEYLRNNYKEISLTL